MTIFGNNGQIINTSKNVNWWSDGSTQAKTNNSIYDGNSIATMTNNTMWTKTGTVTHSRNTFWGPDGTYNLSGGILHGPNGQIWTGVNSEDDAMSIIAHKLK